MKPRNIWYLQLQIELIKKNVIIKYYQIHFNFDIEQVSKCIPFLFLFLFSCIFHFLWELFIIKM